MIMNETLRQIQDRKSCRVFTDEPITPEEKNAILNAAIQAPTAGNMTLYSILDIQDESLKQKLAENCDHQDFIAKAPLVLLFVADYQKYADLFHHYNLDVTPNGTGDLFLAIEDTMIAAHNAVVAAESMGIHSCYIGDIIEQFESNQQLFQLPPLAVPIGLVVFGRPTQSQIQRQKPPRFAMEDVVFQDTYPARSPEQQETMFQKRTGQTRDQIEQTLTNLYHRKIDCDFRREMNRSTQAMLESWTKDRNQ